MGCNCKVVEAVLSLIIILFAVWPNLLGDTTYSKWVIIIAALLMLIHSFACKNCKWDGSSHSMGTKTAKKRR